jgi:hypothetical protein
MKTIRFWSEKMIRYPTTSYEDGDAIVRAIRAECLKAERARVRRAAK